MPSGRCSSKPLRSLPGVIRVIVPAALVGAVLLAGIGDRALAQTPAKLAYPMEMRFDVTVPSDDGTRLSVDVYRPMQAGRYPAVFQLTPYNNNGEGTAEQAWHFVERGYAFVTADVRGRYDSEGEFDPFRNDTRDGAAVMSWIADQTWSDGQVATMGGSYLGMDQWLMAKANHPAHVAMMPYVAPADGFLDLARFNGVPKVDLIYTWSMGMYGRVNQPSDGFVWSEVVKQLPLSELDEAAGRRVGFWREWMEHDRMDSYWEPMTTKGHYQDFDIPSFNVTGWWDGQLLGATKSYEQAVATGTRPEDHVLIIGPWLHGVNRNRTIGERDYGPEAIIDLDRIRDEWLDHRLKGTPRPERANVRYFLQGANEWQSAETWPPPNTRFTSFYLDSRGSANTLFGDGVLREGQPGSGPPDEFAYDPMNPAPTVSSRTSGARGGIAQGSVDNRAVETRQDVLVYTSEPLAQGTEVTGPVTATIYFTTDVPDTDITVKLLDVAPSGRALNLTHGIARARYRNSYENPELLEPGEVHSVEVTLFPTGNYFPAGHRIRVEVSSSNFPLFGRNLNIAGSSETSTEYQVAHTMIFHDGEHASRIVLPLVGRPATE